MRQTRFQIAKKDIKSYFEEHDNKIFSYTEISKILDSNKRYWRLSVNLTTQGFIDLLIKYTKLKKYEIKLPKKMITRYAWDDISPFIFALSLEKNSYLTHYSALFWHNLTDQIPKIIYVNYEQADKHSVNAKLSQQRIDQAFSNNPRR